MRIILLMLLFVAPALPAQSQSEPVWLASSAPTMLIGDEANPGKQFLRIGSVVRLPDGSIIVANGGTNELRLFSPRGEYVRSLSKTGSGPGELRSLGVVFRAGDTLLASESGLGPTTLHYFTSAGFVSKVPLKSAGFGGPIPLGRFSDGRLVVMSGLHAGPPRSPGTIYDDTVSLSILASAGATKPEWAAGFAGPQILLIEVPGGPPGPMPVTYTFGRFLGRTVSGDRLCVGDSRTGLIAQFNSSGNRLAEFKAPIASRSFREDAIARAKQHLLDEASTPASRARIEALYGAPRPSTAPLFTQFVAGYNGEVWIKVYNEDPVAPSSFVVLDAAGRPIGRATLAAGFSLHDVGQDYVLGVLRDEDGVERVASYRLQRR